MTKDRTRQAIIARLLMQHRTALYGYILACVRHHADAEDILQEVSAAVTQSIDQLHDERGFLPWAREIARRRILAHLRKSRREHPADPELVRRLAEAAERVEQSGFSSEYQAALKACLEALPGQSRQLILMHYDGSSVRVGELARHFRRSVQAIYAQIKRIKMALRSCVQRRLAKEMD
ncbi:MAG TPA: sigma-70 family RNA polymerase sigma factor [Gemmataceae bacterium]|nr:sigma-70 family RNA polymerase sigma factor [Gemmataceae bacterium]